MRGVFILEGYLGYEPFLLQRPKRLGANFKLYLFAVNSNCLDLQVRLPDFLGVALAEANIAAVLLAFAGEFTLLHNFIFP